jgi:formylglycine-generating enzyme required for sulfatase activity
MPNVEGPAAEMPAAEKPAAEAPAEGKPVAVPEAEKPAAEPPAAKAPDEEKPANPAAQQESSSEAPAAVKPAAEKTASQPPTAKAPAEQPPAAQQAAAAVKPAGGEAAGDKKPGPTELPTPAWLPKPTDVSDAEANDEASMRPYTEPIPDTDVKFDMVPIKGGKFVMGSPDSEPGRNADEGPQHEVLIEPFWMGKHEVTWDEYELWGLKLDVQRRKLKQDQQKTEPSEREKLADAIAVPTNPYTDMTFSMGKEGYPVICMTQLGAKLYCKWLSAKTGRYYRLPTEAEWEYACRAGTTTAYCCGDDPKQLGDYAWFADNSDDKYHKVGKKKPNPWGLYDMHGNVSEWVIDQYVPGFYTQFAGQSTKEPLAPATTEYNRVVRGGSWADDPPWLRSAVRRASEKDWKKQDPQIPQSIWYLTDGDFLGFRVVRPLRMPSADEAKRYEVDDEQFTELEDYQKAQHGKQ